MARLLTVVVAFFLLSFVTVPLLMAGEAVDARLDQDIKSKPVDIRTLNGVAAPARSRPSPHRINDVLIDVLPGGGGTSGNGRAPQGGRLYINTKYIITGSEMGNAGFAGAVSSVGWEWNNPIAAGTDQGVLTQGTLQVFLKDTTADAIAIAGGSFIDTAGVGYTKIIDATIDIPPGTAQIDIDVPVGGPGTSTYTHIAGHGVLVIFVYHTTTALGTAGAPTVFCNTNVGGNVLYTYQSQTVNGTTGTVSAFRPHTRFGGPPPLVDAIAVPVVYALGKIPIPYGVPQTISAPIRNVSPSISGTTDVTLTVKRASDGLVRFGPSTQAGVAMAVNDTVIVTFPPWTPTIVEDDSIIIEATSLVGETNGANNRAVMIQKVNTNRFAYSQSSVASGGVGFNGSTGDFVAKFTSGTTAVIDSIQVNFSTGGQPYQIGIWDNDGAGGIPGTVLYTTPSSTSVAGVQTLAVSPAVVVNGDYYIGVKQTGTVNVAFSYQAENPIRPNCFYFVAPGGGSAWIDFAPNNAFRFMIEANIAPGFPMSYSSSTTVQNSTPVLRNSTNQQIIGIQVVTTGNLLPITATQFNLNTTGTTSLSDIANAKIWFTGASATFAATTQFGSTVASPSGSYNITGSQALVSGTNHFWLTYDIPVGATIGNSADAECTGITVSGSQTPSVTAPAGARVIKDPLAAGSYTVGLALFNRVSGKALHPVTATRKVLREIRQVNTIDKTAKSFAGNTGGEVADASAVGSVRNIEVEEEYQMLMDNGMPAAGRLFAPVSEVQRQEFGLRSDVIGVYPTITAAIADLNSLGITGAVQFLLTDPTYPSETYPLQINQVAGASASNTVTIRPQTSVTSTIAGSSSSAIFKLNGADYITIDGSNSGGTDRSLTITNSNAGTSSAVVWVASIASPRDSATNNTVKNCILAGNTADATTRYCILSSGATPGGIADAQNNNNTYRNNATTKAVFGVAVVGPTGNESGLVVTQNTIGVSDTIGLNGVAAFQQRLGTITDNTIAMVVTATTGTASGIRIAGTADSLLISANDISNIRNRNLVGWGSNGIQLNSSVTTSKVTVANNFIRDVASFGFNDGTVIDNGYGIIAVTGGSYRIYYNSVNLTLNQDTTSGRPAAMQITAGVSGMNIRNNIFKNSQTVGTQRYAIYSSATDTSFSAINFNDYNTSGANLGFLGATNRVDLAAWKAATGKDQSSVSGDPMFVSSSNLHITSSVSAASGAGTPVAGITTDRDGDPRSPTLPDIGADEFAGSAVLTVASGWNLVSNPVTTSADSVAQLFPTASFPYAFKFQGASGYVQDYTMENGTGYWEKFPASTVNAFSGTARPIDSIAVVSGWNIVGSVTGGVDTSTITSNPPGLRSSTAWFGYSAGYVGAAVISQGKGYWVKANANGKFYFAGTEPPARPASQQASVNPLDALNSVTITDGKGGMQILHFGSDAKVDASSYEMPPVPPAGAFDARFSAAEGGFMVRTHPAVIENVIDLPVDVQSAAYPLTVSWKIISGSYALGDAAGGQAFSPKSMTGEGSAQISRDRFTIKVLGGAGVPTEFALSQNYPNPFNPTTNIRFALPVQSRVIIEIYNVLGQKVRTLLKEDRQAGFHAAEWNGTGNAGQQLGSGVYFLQLSATGADGKSFSDIRKLMLLK